MSENLVTRIQTVLSEYDTNDIKGMLEDALAAKKEAANEGEQLLHAYDSVITQLQQKTAEIDTQLTREQAIREQIAEMQREEMQKDAAKLERLSSSARVDALDEARRINGSLLQEIQQLQLAEVSSDLFGGFDDEILELEYIVELYRALGINPQQCVKNFQSPDEVWQALELLCGSSSHTPRFHSIFEKFPRLRLPAPPDNV